MNGQTDGRTDRDTHEYAYHWAVLIRSLCRCVELLNELLLFRADDEASTKPINVPPSAHKAHRLPACTASLSILPSAQEVLEAAVKRMTACIDDLLAFPQTSSLPDGPLSPLVVRQVWRALKVSRCAAEWQDVLSTNAIQQFVVKVSEVGGRKIYVACAHLPVVCCLCVCVVHAGGLAAAAG